MKTHFVHDLLYPLLFCISMALLAQPSYQMLIENEAMMEAERNGPYEIKCQTLATKSDHAGQYIRLTDFEINGGQSLYENQNSDDLSLAFVATPKQGDVLQTESYDVIVKKSYLAAGDLNDFLGSQTIDGMLVDYQRLDFTHQDALAENHPDINFENCHVILARAPNGSIGVRRHGIVFLCVLIPLSLAGLVWFIYNCRSAVRNGVTMAPRANALQDQPQSHIADLTFDPTPVEIRQPELEEKDAAEAQKPCRFGEIPKPRNWLLLSSMKWSSIALTIAALIALFMPHLISPGIGTLLIFSSLCSVSATLFIFSAATVKPENQRRIAVTESSVPRRFGYFLSNMSWQAKKHDFELVTTIASNLAIKQVSQIYLSKDRTTVLELTKNDIVKGMSFYSILANGKVIQTVDIPLPPMHHPLLGLTTGQKGNFGETYSIHRQIIATFSDVTILIDHQEVDEFLNYVDAIWHQANGRIPMSEITLPAFDDLLRKVASIDLEEQAAV